MPGFGSGPFGFGPFGRYNWAKRVLYDDLPELDRNLDITDGGGRLGTWMSVVQGSFDDLRAAADSFGDLRDPWMVRTKSEARIDVTLLTASTSAGGLLIEVFVDDTDPSDPFVPLGDVSVGWILTDYNGTEFTVNSVHKTDTDGPRLTLQGRESLPSTEADGVGLGAATVGPQELISHLGYDYGVAVDQHEPRDFQRSSIRNAFQWYAIKGTFRSYYTIGEIAGYDVTAYGLWRVKGANIAKIPLTDIYELPFGSGKYYTTLPPTAPDLVNDIGAGVVPSGFYCWEIPDWSGTYPSYGIPDGTTIEDAIAYGRDTITVTAAVVDASNNIWSLTTASGSIDLSIALGVGRWYVASSADTSNIAYMETVPVESPAGVWTFQVIADWLSAGTTQVDFLYDCPIAADCNYCQASVARVEVVPVEVLTDPEANLENALPRIAEKLLQVVPQHVTLVDLVHLLGPIQAVIGISAEHVSSDVFVAAYASLGYYYDIVSGDEIMVDPEHMVATATSYTVP